MRLHADDIGLTRQANLALGKYIGRGQIQSFSIVANMGRATAGACALAHRFSDTPVFLHFNLIEGVPVSLPKQVPSLINSAGKFFPRNRLLGRAFLSWINDGDIHRELLSQLNLLRSCSIVVSGIDSHQHIHAFSPFAEIVAGVADQQKIPFIRSYGVMRVHTVTGRLKLRLLKSLATVSVVRRYGARSLPVSWRRARWEKFCIASWEKINRSHVTADEVVVFHPGLSYDKTRFYEEASGLG